MSHLPHFASCLRPFKCGFTLFETVLVIALLTLASVVLMKLQPSVFKTQIAARDEVVGLEIQRACAERLLTVRRSVGYAAVQGSAASAPTCNGLGGTGGFAANPSVTLTDAAAATIANCTSATCTATITATKTSGPAAALPALTVRLSNY